MPYNQCFFHGLSVTMEPHCALNTAKKKSLDSMSNNSYRQIQNSLLEYNGCPYHEIKVPEALWPNNPALSEAQCRVVNITTK